MEGLLFFSGNLAVQPLVVDGIGHVLEYSFRGAVLLVLMSEVEYTDLWNWDQLYEEHSTTFATLESLRGTYRSWMAQLSGKHLPWLVTTSNHCRTLAGWRKRRICTFVFSTTILFSVRVGSSSDP